MRKIIGAYLNTIDKESTRTTRQKHLRMFAKWLVRHRIGLNVLTQQHLQNYKNFLTLTRRCKSRTVASYFQTLRAFFGWMVEQGVINASPVSDIETKRRNIIRLNLTNEQLRNIGRTYASNALRDWLVFSIMVLPGLTPEEVMNIRMSDVRFEHVPRIILSKDTLIYINPEIQPILRQYLKCTRNSDFLFHNEDGNQMSVSAIRKIRRDGMKRLRNINIHTNDRI